MTRHIDLAPEEVVLLSKLLTTELADVVAFHQWLKEMGLGHEISRESHQELRLLKRIAGRLT